jgi:hypothetical protein
MLHGNARGRQHEEGLQGLANTLYSALKDATPSRPDVETKSISPDRFGLKFVTHIQSAHCVGIFVSCPFHFQLQLNELPPSSNGDYILRFYFGPRYEESMFRGCSVPGQGRA